MILVDGNPILYRAFFTYDLCTSRGEHSNVVYGSLKILTGLFKRLGADQTTTIFWDLGKSAYRLALYPEYKAGRKSASREGYPSGSFEKQAEALRTILNALGVRQVQVRGVEADDLLAIATTTGVPPYTIVSDDLDLWQLVEEGKVNIYSPRKDAWISTREECYRATKVYPEQIVDFKALAGDVSDSIPGVEGIGEKTAHTILAVCKDLPDLYTKIRSGERLPVGKKIRDRLLSEEDKVKLWYDLCQPLSFDMLTEEQQKTFSQQWSGVPMLNRQDLVRLLEEWELREFLGEFDRFIATFNVDTGPDLAIAADFVPLVQEQNQTVTKLVDPVWDQIAKIHHDVLACQACTLRKECRMPVPGGIDDPNHGIPTVMVVGRNPGQNEDKQGKGFVGRSGARLNQLLAGLDDTGKKLTDKLLDRSRVWITNVARCYSLSNRPPTEQEWHTCAGLYLREEIKVLKPKLILSFGAEAMTALTGFDDSIMQRAGSCVIGSESDGVVQYAVQDGERRWDPVIPDSCNIILLPHPSAALRTRSAELKFQQCGRILEEWLKQNPCQQ